jgi:Iron-containing redox enzyme
MLLPEPRGPITQHLQAVGGVDVDKVAALLEDVDASSLDSDDVQLALWTLYEMHFQGFEDVDPRAEWDPDRIAIRGLLERRLETELRDLTRSTVEAALGADASIAERIFGLVRDDDGPQLAAYVQREMTDEQLHELLMQRSVYHLKEADPHTFAVPRLRGRAKAALMEIQFDEYGAGRPDDMHSALFARTLRACGLDDAYGAYVEVVPGYILAASNAMSMFGLHRRPTQPAVRPRGSPARVRRRSRSLLRRARRGRRRTRAGGGPRDVRCSRRR